MNLRQPNANEATGTFNRSKSVVPMSGLCSRCVDGCRGGCEIWLTSFRGREVLYPIQFGEGSEEHTSELQSQVYISRMPSSA